MRGVRTLLAVALAASAAACATAPKLASACTTGQPGSIEGDWVLVQLDGADPVARRDITLEAGAEGFGGFMNCNSYGGLTDEGAAYRIEDGRLRQTGDGIITTTAGCMPREYMDADRAYLDILSADPHVSRQADALCLYTDDGRSLEFRQIAEAAP